MSLRRRTPFLSILDGNDPQVSASVTKGTAKSPELAKQHGHNDRVFLAIAAIANKP